jgi:hypothetical protein
MKQRIFYRLGKVAVPEPNFMPKIPDADQWMRETKL